MYTGRFECSVIEAGQVAVVEVILYSRGDIYYYKEGTYYYGGVDKEQVPVIRS